MLDPESTRQPAGPLSQRQRRFYLAVTLFLPWTILALVEVALRLGGSGNGYPLFIAYPDRPDYLFLNPQIAKRYFGDGPFVPTPQGDFFRKTRTPQGFRIVFQGESSALGFPYLHGGAPSRMVEQRLQATFPDRDIEVINTALTAVNSYTLLDFADEIIATRPDAVMIYTGHNEYYGIFGAGSARSASHNPQLVRTYLALRRLRTVQLLTKLLPGESSEGGANRAEQARSVMELMAGDQRIPLGSPVYNEGLEQFRRNIGDLLAKYRAHGIPVFVGTVASNERDQRPFIGATAQSLYTKAKVADGRGDYGAAASLYRAAKDNDELRFRAPEAINQIIRAEAARHGAEVVETQRALEHASPQGIIGHQVMLEHLHPNIDGYFLIADAFVKALKQRHMVGEWTNPQQAADPRRSVPVTSVDSLAGLYHADRLTSGWPFQPKGRERQPIVDTLRPRNLEEELAQGMVLNRLSWPEAMTRLREVYEKGGDPDRALHVALSMAQEYRYAAQPFVDAARIEVQRKNYNAAVRYIIAATRREEKPITVQLAGLLLLRTGDHTSGVKYLERSVQLAPGERSLAVALRAAKALPDLEASRARDPRDTTVIYTLAGAYALTQQYEKSRESLAALFQVSPEHPGGRQLLKRLPPR